MVLESDCVGGGSSSMESSCSTGGGSSGQQANRRHGVWMITVLASIYLNGELGQ